MIAEVSITAGALVETNGHDPVLPFLLVALTVNRYDWLGPSLDEHSGMEEVAVRRAGRHRPRVDSTGRAGPCVTG